MAVPSFRTAASSHELAELSAILRAIAATRKQAAPALMRMAEAYERGAVLARMGEA